MKKSQGKRTSGTKTSTIPRSNMEPVNSGSVWPMTYVHNENSTPSVFLEEKRGLSSNDMKMGKAARKNIAAEPIPNNWIPNAMEDWMSSNAEYTESS